VGALCVFGLSSAVGAQVDEDQPTVNGEVRSDRPEAPARARGPHRERLTLEREAQLGLSPAFTFVGLGVTATLGGLLVWSLVDTLAASDRYMAGPTRERYEDGRRKVRRTWLLGSTCGAFAITTLLIAILGTDWDEDDDRLALRPSASRRGASLALEGRF